MSNRRDVGLARANAHSVFDVEDKYFTIPDLPGLRGRSDGLDGSVGQLARDCHLNLDLGYKRGPGRQPFDPKRSLADAGAHSQNGTLWNIGAVLTGPIQA